MLEGTVSWKALDSNFLVPHTDQQRSWLHQRDQTLHRSEAICMQSAPAILLPWLYDNIYLFYPIHHLKNTYWILGRITQPIIVVWNRILLCFKRTCCSSGMTLPNQRHLPLMLSLQTSTTEYVSIPIDTMSQMFIIRILLTLSIESLQLLYHIKRDQHVMYLVLSKLFHISHLLPMSTSSHQFILIHILINSWWRILYILFLCRWSFSM